jgi:hypothetical protein
MTTDSKGRCVQDGLYEHTAPYFKTWMVLFNKHVKKDSEDVLKKEVDSKDIKRYTAFRK